MRRIVDLDHSVAFTDEEGVIFINKHLKSYNKDLYKRIIKHERSHNLGSYDYHDLKLDFKNNISQMELLKFCIVHPRGFMQYSPIVKVKGKLLYSWLSLAKIIILVAVIWGTIVIFT